MAYFWKALVANLLTKVTRKCLIRLGYFWKVFVTNLVTKVGQNVSNFFWIYLKISIICKDCCYVWSTFGKKWASFNSIIWSHWIGKPILGVKYDHLFARPKVKYSTVVIIFSIFFSAIELAIVWPTCAAASLPLIWSLPFRVEMRGRETD